MELKRIMEPAANLGAISEKKKKKKEEEEEEVGNWTTPFRKGFPPLLILITLSVLGSL